MQHGKGEGLLAYDQSDCCTSANNVAQRLIVSVACQVRQLAFYLRGEGSWLVVG
jgi:hypothetical protein